MSYPYPLMNPPVPSEPVSNVNQPPSLISLYANQKNEKQQKMPPGSTHEKKIGSLFRTAVFATIAYIILSQPVTYRVTNTIYSMITNKQFYIVNEDGCPTVVGTIANTLIFFIVILFLMF